MLSGFDVIVIDGKCVKIVFKCLFDNKYDMIIIWFIMKKNFKEKKNIYLIIWNN